MTTRFHRGRKLSVDIGARASRQLVLASCEALEQRRLLRNPATFYFDLNKTNPSNNGLTPDTAFSSLSAIGSKFTPQSSDKLMFHAGQTFSGSIDLHTYPNLNSVILDTFAQNATANLYRATISSGNNRGLWMINTNDCKVMRLNFTGTSLANKLKDNFGVELDVTAAPSSLRGRRNTIQYSTITGYGSTGLVGLGSATNGSAFQDLKIDHVDVNNCGKYGIIVKNTNGFNHQRINITWCNVSNIPGYSVADGAKVDSTWGSGITIFNSIDSKIENCTSHDNGINNNATGGGPVGIWMADAKNAIIQLCKSYKNHHTNTTSPNSTTDGGGFDFDNNVYNSFMQYNFSHDNDGAGFLCYSASDKTNDSNTIRYNVSSNDGRAQMGGIRISGKVTKLKILHNTVYCNLSVRKQSEAGISAIAINSIAPKDLVIENNIVVTGGAIPTRALVTGTTFTQKNNDYYTLNTVTGEPTLNNTGVNSGNFRADPHFAGTIPAQNAFFSPASGSPTAFKITATAVALIDNALTTADDGTRDYFGTLLSAHPKRDIGAYELPSSG